MRRRCIHGRISFFARLHVADDNKSVPWTTEVWLASEWAHPASLGTLVCHCRRQFAPHNPSIRRRESRRPPRRPSASHKRHAICAHRRFRKVSDFPLTGTKRLTEIRRKNIYIYNDHYIKNNFLFLFCRCLFQICLFEHF